MVTKNNFQINNRWGSLRALEATLIFFFLRDLDCK